MRMNATRSRPVRALALLLALAAGPAAAETLRLATFNADLSRDGPGLLLRDILSGEDARIGAAADIVVHVDPDILLITKFDYDRGGAALDAFAETLAERGAAYPHRFALRPNTGMATGRDMIGDGRRGTADDKQGYGRFAGQAGMALLSRHPVADGVRDFSDFLWRDLPGALIPERDGAPFPSDEVFEIQRLSTTGHWDVPVALPDGRVLNLLAFYTSPPVFGGPENRNLRRNHDEVRFWTLLLDGELPMPPPEPPFAVIGDSNLDPHDGDGMQAAMRDLLAHPALQDPAPESAGALAAAGEAEAAQAGDPARDTTEWRMADGPGNLRVDYVLPSAELTVRDAEVFWPHPDDPAHALLGEGDEAASRHRLVWVDIALER